MYAYADEFGAKWTEEDERKFYETFSSHDWSDPFDPKFYVWR